MSIHQIERLTRQNRRLADQLKQSNRKISTLQHQSQCEKQTHQKLQQQMQFLHQQISQLRRRQQQQKYKQQQTESRYLNVLQKMEDQLQERKRKYTKLQGKIEPLIDQDTVRLKILNQVESVHFMELEEGRRKGDRLKDQVLRLRRQNQVCKHQMEAMKIDHQQQIRKIKIMLDDRDKNSHFNSMTYEMCMDIQNRLRINYQQARKESQYYKEKYFSCEKRYQERIGQLEKEIIHMKQHMLGSV